MLIIKKLIVDEYNDLFDTEGMELREFASEYSQVRRYTAEVIKPAPEAFKEGNLLEQQLSEIIKNGIKHGNHCDPARKLRVWFSYRKRTRLIVEDEGEGFQNIEEWNEFFRKRQEAVAKNDFDTYLALAAFRTPKSDDSDGGNSLIAAIDFWNGGMVYNRRKNKVGVVRWYTGGSSR